MLINWPKIPQMPQNLKSGISKKRLYWASVVLSPCFQVLINSHRFLVLSLFYIHIKDLWLDYFHYKSYKQASVILDKLFHGEWSPKPRVSCRVFSKFSQIWSGQGLFTSVTRDIHIECSKQFKWNLYFYVTGQSRPFWAVLKLLWNSNMKFR